MEQRKDERDELSPNDPTRKTTHPDPITERGGGTKDREDESDLQRRQSEGNLGNERNRNNPDSDEQTGDEENLNR